MIKKGFTTTSLHTPFPKDDVFNALHFPIYDGVAYEFDTAEDIAESFEGKRFAHAYSRTSNPTVEYFERKLLAVTGAHAALALASGMAAISNVVLALVGKGENIISSNHLFGHSYALFKNTLAEWDIEVRFADMSNLQEVESLCDINTRAFFFETITNPQLEVIDIDALSHVAKKHNAVLIADSSVTPPSVFNSKQHGVDVEVMSSTKFISGGATSVGGVILDNGTFDWTKIPNLKKWSGKMGKDALIARLRKEIFRHLGGCMTAHTAHFQIIGLDILALRVERAVSNCLALGEFLKSQPKISEVNYPGLHDSPNYLLSLKQFDGKPGSIMTFDLPSKDVAFKFYNNLKIIRRATNLNDNKTLIIHPHSTIYAEFSLADKESMGIRDTMFRLSVGIEDVNDLIYDIEQALATI